MKSIVAVADGCPGDEALLNAAASLAQRFGARLRVIPAFPDPAAGLVAYGVALGRDAGAAGERIAEGERKEQQRLEALAREAVLRAGVDQNALLVEQRALQPAIAAAEAAVLADVMVFEARAARGPLSGLFAEMLLNARAPMLAVRGPLSFGPAAIAWDGSPQAGRAVRAATPLLRQATGVHVLRNLDDAAAIDVERLKGYLAAHGVAKINVREVRGGDVAGSLLAEATNAGAEVIVAGGYGRPRLYELVLGGATRGFLAAERGPNLFLAH